MNETRNFQVGTRVQKLSRQGSVLQIEEDEWLGERVLLLTILWDSGERTDPVPSDDYKIVEAAT